MKKRIWALFLAVMMVVSVLPTTAFAEDAAGSTELAPGQIRATKSLVLDEEGNPVMDEDGYYTIQLAVQGAPVKADKAVDVILCIDVSNSMTGSDGYVVEPGDSCNGRIEEIWEDHGEWKQGRYGRWYWDSEWVQTGWYCSRCGETWDISDGNPGRTHETTESEGVTRLDIAKDAADHFATELLGAELDIRMGVVAFGGNNGGTNDYYSFTQELTTSQATVSSFIANVDTPENLYDRTPGGSTNYTLGLYEARQMLEDRTGDDAERTAFILFLSDGYPGYNQSSTSDRGSVNWNGTGQAAILMDADGLNTTIYTGGIDLEDSQYLEAISSEKDGKKLYQEISNDNMAEDLENLMNIVKEDAFIAAGRDAIMVDVVNTEAFDMDVETSATLKKSGSTVTWTIGTITEEIQTVQIKVKPNGDVYGRDIKTNGSCVLTYTDPDGNKREIECASPTVDIPAPVSYVIDGEGPDEDEYELPETENYLEEDTVTVEDCLDDVETEGGTWVFQGWTTEDAVVADGEFTMPKYPVVFVGTWKFTPATTDPSEIEPVGAVYETEYYFEESVGGAYEIDAELTTRTPELLGTEVTGEELDEDKVPANYVFDPVETGNKNKGTVEMPTPILGEDGETVVGVNLTTLEMYYSLDENGDGTPDKYQTTVTFEVVNGSWDDESTDAKEIVVTLTDEDGVWAEDGSYTLTEDDIPAVGTKPADNFKAGAWDKDPAGAEITGETTFTYTYVRGSEGFKPYGAVYETEYYFEESVGGAYEIDAELTTRTPELLGTEVTGEKLAEDKVPANYVFDPVETGDKNKGTVEMPTPILGEDGETVAGVNLTTLEMYYSLDENGDGTPDKYQTTVTFEVVNGSWDDESTDAKEIVVTLTDEDGAWAEDGSYTLTEDDIPAVGTKPADNFKAGAWDKDPAGEEITGETTFTYTYVRKNEVIEPVAAVYKVEHYKQISVGGEYELVTDDVQFPLFAAIGETVTATAKDYGKFYRVNEELSEMSGEVFMPVAGEDAEEPTYLILKVYYDLLEAKVSITKAVDGATTVKVGDTAKYTITVTNTGNVVLNNAKVVDELTGDEWTIEVLGVGESKTFNASYKATSKDAGKKIKNIAVVEVPEGPNDEAVNEEVTVKPNDPITPVGPAPKPQLSKADHLSYIIGYDDGTVRPLANITRAEVATIFFRLLTEESRAQFWSQENPFPDVTEDMWCNNAISTMFNAGIITGYPDGTFQPYAPVTRAEFATIAARFSNEVSDGVSDFFDVPEGYWAYEYIALAEDLGWVQGYEGYFRPLDNMTRAEVMTTVNRVLERSTRKENMLKDMIEWPDNDPTEWYYEAVQEATNSHEYYRTSEKVYKLNFYYEAWTKLIENPDWAALERTWSDANSQR